MILPSSSYIHGTSAIFLSDLNCNGDEGALLDCPRRFNIPPGLVMSCDHSQDVGILCPGVRQPIISQCNVILSLCFVQILMNVNQTMAVVLKCAQTLREATIVAAEKDIC